VQDYPSYLTIRMNGISNYNRRSGRLHNVARTFHAIISQQYDSIFIYIIHVKIKIFHTLTST